MGSRTLSGANCRKLFVKGRSRFVAAAFLLMLVSSLGLDVGDSGLSEDVGARENLWKSSIKLDKGSNDHFRRRIRTRIEHTETLSTTQSDRIQESTRSIIEERQGTGLSERQRRLANGTIATLEGETGLPVEVNATVIEEAVMVEFSRAILVLTILLGVIAILLSISSSIFVYLYRNNILVAIGQPPCKFGKVNPLDSFSTYMLHFTPVMHCSHLDPLFQSSTSSVSAPSSCPQNCSFSFGMVL